MNSNTHLNDHLIHDLRTPIAMLSTLGAGQNLPKEIQDSLASCTQYLEGIVSRYFGLPAKPQSNHSIIQILNDKMDLFRNEKVNFKTELQSKIDDLSLLNIDPLNFNRLLFNLIGNAIGEFKANNISNPEISITSYNCKQYFYLSLSDNGCGFPPELLDGSSNPPSARGLGLGLNCIKQIIQESGGEFKLSNRPEGGADVLLQIPLVSNLGKTVVLYEDEPLFINLWKQTYRNSGMKLVINPQNPPEKDALIFIDVNLKEKSGLQIAQELHNKGHTNLFLTTSYEPEQFENISYIRGVIGKEPPALEIS
ncbi:MAG: hypothetical protein CME63_14830 [Halobacteriovoraceae bacterium]|nr:hypothetical protein [Halobacteriovoraceae bacterium]|tara:strand:- start:65071 stop:65997 length:927 start_codon:yes stop_codon:yes gene_type:complete